MSELPKISELLKQPEKMRLMCAEACGTADFYAVVKNGLFYRPNECGYTDRIEEAGRYSKAKAESLLVSGEYMQTRLLPCPKYDTSLDAMAAAEATLTDEESDGYMDALTEVCGGIKGRSCYMAYFATAIQRLAAFLIAKGLAQP
ncbi:MAG: hypothetical protein ACEQSB_06150 [Undibacterium sp.]